MRNRSVLAAALLLGLATFHPVGAQPGPTPAPVDATARRAVVAELSRQLQTSYVFPEVARAVATSLKTKEARGGYATATDTDAFARALTRDLQTLGKDLHFQVDYDPEFQPQPEGEVRSAADLEAERAMVARRAYGIERVQRLPGNVGLLEVRGFGPAEMVGEAMTSAMKLLSGTDALILDLRRNDGGEPAGVAHLLSHFFAQGDERHLNDIYDRPRDSTRHYWTHPGVLPRYTRPVYVLISPRTISGGEECAYDLQTQKRATLVGETTAGAANPGGPVALGNGMVAFIPTGRSINPVTRTNWEHVGVKPDIAAPAAEAQKVAYIAALRELLKTEQNADIRESLQKHLAGAEAGKEEKPVYTLPPR